VSDSVLTTVHVFGGAALQRAAPALVSPPPLGRRLPMRGRVKSPGGTANPAVWLLGVHGGAGVTSLIRAGVGGQDAEKHWPAHGAVVVVARRSICGLEWARDVARQHASGCAPDGVVLAGLVAVADAPGRIPTPIAVLLELVSGAYPRVWEVPWVEQWRLASHTGPVPSPPAVSHLAQDVQALIDDCSTQ